MASYLPNGDNCTVLYADVFMRDRRVPGSRFRHMGIVDKAAITLEVERSDKTWKGEVVKQKTTSKSASLALTMGETTWTMFKAALMATEADLLQDAGAVSVTVTAIESGEMIELGAFGVTGLELANGVTELVDGVDYKPYDTSTNFVVMLTAQSSVTATGTAPALSAGDRKALAIMGTDTGLAGEFRFVGENTEGQRVIVDGILADLASDGEIVLHSDSTDFQTYSLNGKVIRNPLSNSHPFGRVLPAGPIV
jgi:hypothetical protein